MGHACAQPSGRPGQFFEDEFELVRALESQCGRTYDFADVLIARAGSRITATGSKLTDAYREIADVANQRFAHQYVFAIVDGIGWHSRLADLRRIHELWATKKIDGMYTLASLGQFRADLEDAAHRARLI